MSALNDNNTDYTQPATGFTYTVPNNKTTALLDPAGTLATGTINMPTAPIDGQILTVACSQVITALTMATGTGSLLGGLSSMSLNGFACYQYKLSNTTWYRVG